MATNYITGQILLATDLTAGFASKLDKAGGTLTGALTGTSATFTTQQTLGSNTSNGDALVINGAAQTLRRTLWETAGVRRWGHSLSTEAEGGSNVGSNWQLSAFSDAGANIGTPLNLSRSTGLLTLTPLSPAVDALLTQGTIKSVGPISVIGPTGGVVLSGSTGMAQINASLNILGSYSGNEGILNLQNSVDTAAITGPDGFSYATVKVSRQFGGVGTDGGRAAAAFSLTQTLPATNSTSGQYVTLGAFFTSIASAGGTAPTTAGAKGVGYAFYPQAILKAGAINYDLVSIAEGDVGIEPTKKSVDFTGSVTAGDTFTLTFTSTTIAGSPVAVTHTAGAGVSLSRVVNNLMALARNNTALRAAGVTAIQDRAASTRLTMSWPQQNTVTGVLTTTSGTAVLTPGSVVGGASAKKRFGFSITRGGPDGAQGVEQDGALTFGSITQNQCTGQWATTILFDPVTAYNGTMIGAREQQAYTNGAVQGPLEILQSKYGLDFSLVNYSLASGASIRVPAAQIDGSGVMSLKNFTFTADTNGMTIDGPGRVGSGNPTIVSGGGGGAGQDSNVYFVGEILKGGAAGDWNGGQYLVTSVDPATGAVTGLTTLVQPSTATTSLGVAIATTGGSGTGCTITPTGVANNSLSLVPTAGGKIGFYGHAPVVQAATPVTLADVIAVIRGVGLAA